MGSIVCEVDLRIHSSAESARMKSENTNKSKACSRQKV